MEYCEKCGYIIQQCDCEKPKTNADRIRSMTDEELAKFLYGLDHYWNDGECILRIGNELMNDSRENILDWLQEDSGV